MYPAGYLQEFEAENLASEFGLPVFLTRIVILTEENEEDVAKRHERLLLLIKLLFGDHIEMTNDNVDFMHKVVRHLAVFLPTYNFVSYISYGFVISACSNIVIWIRNE